jgi:hypothetical protein
MKTILGPILLLFTLTVNCAYFIADYRSQEQKFNNSICQIHNVKMKSKLCWIQYGLIASSDHLFTPEEKRKKNIYDSLYLIGKKTTFANAYISNMVKGGCLLKSQKWARIYYCTECNTHEKKWLKENESINPYPKYKREEYLPRNNSEIRY